ncbi:MAG: hypothetical protein AAGM16_08190 [Pseudomonadota bacterium]
MHALIKTTLVAAVAAVTMAAASPAEARTNARMLEACEDAIRTELGNGHTRINRIRNVEADGNATFWLTVRHKVDTADKSARYRALCEVGSNADEASISIETGWWREGRRGQAPLAID